MWLESDKKQVGLASRYCCLQAGGFVADGRVNGSLNLSRALGDMEYKRSAELQAAEQARHPAP